MQQAAAQILARSNLSRNWLSRHGSETSAEPCDKTEKNERYPWSKKKCLLGDHVPRLEFHPILHQQDRVLEPHGLGGD